MIKRTIVPRLRQSLAEFPAIALLGPRQAAESLTGRIDPLELAPLTLDEVGATTVNRRNAIRMESTPCA